MIYRFEGTVTFVEVKEVLDKFKNEPVVAESTGKWWGPESPEHCIYPVTFGIEIRNMKFLLKGEMYTLKEPKTGTKYIAVLDDICVFENGMLLNLDRKNSKFVSMLGIVEYEEIKTNTYCGLRFTWTNGCY